VSAQLALAEPRRIKATHRRRRRIASGQSVQRYYDPSLGRFLSTDPAASQFNLFDYASNNPFGYMDPDGRATTKADKVCNNKAYQCGDASQVAGTDAGTAEDEDARERRILAEARAPVTVSSQQVANGAATTGDVVEAGFWFLVTDGAGRAISELVSSIPFTNVFKLFAKSDEAITGRTVLGSYPAYLGLGKATGGRVLEIPMAQWNAMTREQQWAANAKFLDRGIARGEIFILTVQSHRVKPGTFLMREIEYLQARGYTISPDKLRLLPPAK